jgi:hypothetical protein
MLMLAIKGLHVQPDMALQKDHPGVLKVDGPLSGPLGVFGPSGDMFLFQNDKEKVFQFFSSFG